MSAKVVRALALVTFFAFGIPGMIVASIKDNAGAAVTFGLIAASVAVALIACSAVTLDRRGPPGVDDPGPADEREAQAEALEARVRAVVGAGADEDAVRDLVRVAMRVARRPPP